MIHGSPLWQGILFFAAFLFLVWETWRGWRAGVIRSGIHLAAIVVSMAVGMVAARLAAAPFGGLGEIPGFITGMIVGGGLGIFVFLLIWFLGAILFKRTEHQDSALFRLLWGSGGAVFGFLLGLIIVWSGISVVRTLGAMGRARLETSRSHSTQPSGVASGLVTLKKSLELGPTGRVVSAIDPLPTDFYQLITQISRISSDQETMLRFLQSPEIQDVMQSPRMAELLSNPDIIEAAQNRNIFALMNNKALRDAINDPALAKQLQNVDLRAALEFALKKPAEEPSELKSNPPPPTPAPN